jgi:hypothetical protein
MSDIENRNTLLEAIGELFGFKLKKKESVELPSFVPKDYDDGALTISPSGIFGEYLDLEGRIFSDHELVSKYRELALQPEIDFAVNDIVSEAIVIDDIEEPVSVDVDDIEFSDKIKESIREEFQNVVSLLNFNNRGHDIFRQWYVDGRLYYHAVVAEGKEKGGIKEIRNIDPRKIRKIREIVKEPTPGYANIIKKTDEYFVFNPNGFIDKNSPSTSGMKISKDAIIYITSGLYDAENTLVLSNLHKTIKPYNMLKMLEDAAVIYYLSRAPERRIFYIDVGNLPKAKADQYVAGIMGKYRNKMVYDAETGNVRDDKRHMSMLEDFWIPRREGGKGTEITTLGGGNNLTDNIESIEYFRKKLFKALNVPYSRMDSENQWSLGRTTEISRDEMRFARFIDRLRSKFNILFDEILGRQLILKRIVTESDWNNIKKDIKYRYNKDSYFSEMKDIEVVRERFNLLRDIDEYSTNAAARDQGKHPEPWISNAWIRKNVLQQNDDDIKAMNKEIKKELEKMTPDKEDGDSEVGGDDVETETNPSANDNKDSPEKGSGQEQETEEGLILT